MSKRCSVCNHPQRHEIDVALVEGASNRHVMARFGVGRMAVQRHRDDHIPDALWRSQRVREHTEADALMGRVLTREGRADRLYDLALRWHDRAEAANDPNTALHAIAEARKNLGEARQTAALLFGRRDIRDLETKLDELLRQTETEGDKRW